MRTANQFWGLNLLCTETGHIALACSESRTTATIATFLLSHLPQNEEHVMTTDEWSATKAIRIGEIDGYEKITHKTVNHSKEWVNSDGDHTNTVESKNRMIRDTVFKPLNGVSAQRTALYCQLFQFLNNTCLKKM